MIRVLVALSVFVVALGGIIPSSDNHKEEYIVGGKETNITETPYQAALYVDRRFYCGGSIITPNHVLTAAHCVEEMFSNYNVRVGSSKRTNGGQFIAVKNVTYHPKFSFNTFDFDVAVIELATSLKFNASIKAIKLADKEPADGEKVKVSGWGCLKENGHCPINLQSVEVPVVNRKVCSKNYENFLNVTARMICAGQEGKDACQGDSGGPLAYKGTIVGIVSWGEGCARKDRPGIYASVANPEIRKFIKQHANV